MGQLTAAKGEEKAGNGGKKGKELVKEHVWVTCGHGQLCEDWQGEQGLGRVDEGKQGGGWGATVIE